MAIARKSSALSRTSSSTPASRATSRNERPDCDAETLGPSQTLRVRWREDAPGVWYYHCHVESHMDNGMIGLYDVARR